MARRAKRVEVAIVIAAPAVLVFDILADPRNHPRIDGSGTLTSLIFGPERLSMGARFGMRMRMGIPYRMTNLVTVFSEGSEIGWRHVGRHVWRYSLTPLGPESTRVAEIFEWDRAPLGPIYPAAGVIARNLMAMRRTLGALQELAEGEYRRAST